MQPSISVVIPLYNKEKSIAKTISSVLRQTHDTFEVVVVDDGSTDNSAKIVSEIKDVRVRTICQSNAGVSAARNRGIKVARYDYVAFLDGDDLWQENHLQEMASLIEDYGSEADVFVTNFTRRFPDGDEFVNRDDLPRGVIYNYFKELWRGGKAIINSSCVCVSKAALLAVGGFNVKYTHGEDIDLWNRLARKYKVACTPKSTSIYSIDPSGSCSTMNYKTESAKDALRGVSKNPYDLLLSMKRYSEYLVKRLLNYQPRIRKPSR